MPSPAPIPATAACPNCGLEVLVNLDPAGWTAIAECAAPNCRQLFKVTLEVSVEKYPKRRFRPSPEAVRSMRMAQE